MRTVMSLLVIVAIAAIARAEPGTGTVVIGCNEADAEIVVDNVLIPERTPAVLTLATGAHVIEVRKPPLVAQKQVVQVAEQQQVKVRFELQSSVPPAPPAGSDAGSGAGPGSATGSGSGSSAPAGPSAPPATGSAAGSNAAAPPPLPPVQPGVAAIDVATTAASALVYVDGAPIHAAPCLLEVEPGDHVIAVYAAGLVPVEAVVHVQTSERQRVELTPTKSRRRLDVPAQ